MLIRVMALQLVHRKGFCLQSAVILIMEAVGAYFIRLNFLQNKGAVDATSFANFICLQSYLGMGKVQLAYGLASNACTNLLSLWI